MKNFICLLGGTVVALAVISGSSAAGSRQVMSSDAPYHIFGCRASDEISGRGVASAGCAERVYKLAVTNTFLDKSDPALWYSPVPNDFIGAFPAGSLNRMVMTLGSRVDLTSDVAVSGLQADNRSANVPKPESLFLLGAALLGLAVAARITSIKPLSFRQKTDNNALQSNRRGGNKMPSLKIGCRVTYKSGVSATLKAYDTASSKPWLLAMPSRLVWASDDEFCNPDHAPMRLVHAQPDKLKAYAGFPKWPVGENLAFNFLGAFFRRLSAHSPALPVDHK